MLPSYPEYRVDHLTAAQIQLESAVCLHFLHAHPAVILTLAAASQEILGGLLKKAKAVPSELSSELIKGDLNFCLGVAEHFNEKRNFLKHYQGDSEKTIEVAPNSYYYWIVLAIENWKQLGQPCSPVFRTYMKWANEVFIPSALHLSVEIEGTAQAPFTCRIMPDFKTIGQFGPEYLSELVTHYGEEVPAHLQPYLVGLPPDIA